LGRKCVALGLAQARAGARRKGARTTGARTRQRRAGPRGAKGMRPGGRRVVAGRRYGSVELTVLMAAALAAIWVVLGSVDRADVSDVSVMVWGSSWA
jgi:hypothetical protein